MSQGLFLTHLSNGSCEQVYDPLVRDCDHALSVDLDDAVAHADAAALGDPAAQQTADLEKKEQKKVNSGFIDAQFLLKSFISMLMP